MVSESILSKPVVYKTFTLNLNDEFNLVKPHI